MSAGRVSAERFRSRLAVRHPIIQAPMGGGPTTPALAAAVSNAGGLGFLAGGYLDPEGVRDQVLETRRLTGAAFGVNAFVEAASHDGTDTDPGPMLRALAPWALALGIEPPQVIPSVQPNVEAVAELVLALDVPVFSVTFGVPERGLVRALHERGVVVLGTATTVEEAVLLQEAGVDAVVAQGAEAGAHRGSFVEPFEKGMVGTMALVPQVVEATDLPVIASGGIMDGRGIVAALALGAAAVQMGTAFLLADEARVSEPYRRRLLTAREDETAVTRVFSGRPARGIRNRFMNEIEAAGLPIPPYPIQNSLTRPLRQAGAAAGDGEVLSLWAGQGLRLGRAMPAGQLVSLLAEEAESTLATLCGSLRPQP